jgi:hypothetical protein
MKIRFKSSVQLRKLVGVILLVCGLQLYAQQTASGEDAAPKATISTFDPPGSTPPQTYPQAINPAGVIVGYYIDAGGIPHGFLRARDGTFPSFDPLAPGLGSLAALGAPGGSKAFGINPALAITGYYYDANGTAHCFLRAPNGKFTNVDPPGSLGSTDSYPIVINPAREITGNYFDGTTFSTRSFVRAPGGNFTLFDAPPGSQGSNGIVPQAINPAGAITGWYQDPANFYAFHGFLRDSKGITTFDPPDASNNPYTQPLGINPAGAITGWYQVIYQQTPPRGFLRDPKTGNIITFVYPGTYLGTSAFAINPAWTITGNYVDANSVYHCFLRARNGKFTTFDVPVPGSFYPTPLAINPAGEITGYYSDATGTHGFLRIPAHPDE